MTRTKKLFVAAVILAAGYGAASLLGEPAAMLISRNALPDNPAIAKTASAAALSAPMEHAPGELRLVPDARPIEVPTPEATLQRPERVPNSLSTDLSLADVAAAPASPPNEPAWFSTFNMNSEAAPRATLRNEAPRPLFTEPRTGATIRSAQQVGQVNVTPSHAGPLTGQQSGTALSAVVSAEYAQGAARRETEQTALATSPTVQTYLGVPFVEPPPVASLEEDESRTHIVVDGDSLTKLAGRYLDDPQRGNEIYDHNRHVLSDPELLPIGAELVIPSRNRLGPTWNLPQSALPGSVAVHSAARGGLVPVRPLPSNAVMTPRAQLSRPLPAP